MNLRARRSASLVSFVWCIVYAKTVEKHFDALGVTLLRSGFSIMGNVSVLGLHMWQVLLRPQDL